MIASRGTTSISAALAEAHIESIDAEVLLCYVLQKPRSWLLAHGNESVTEEQERAFHALVARRRSHEPVAYLTGEKEFYGRKFFVDRRVLIPRPSTEALIDEAMKLYDSLSSETAVPFIDKWYKGHIVPTANEIVILTRLFPQKLMKLPHFAAATRGRKAKSYTLPREANKQPLTIVDVGTGSGCIGITLALELPHLKIVCTDISEGALEVARENARRHNVLNRLTFLRTDLLPSPNPDPIPFLVVSNPPYIPEVPFDTLTDFRAGPCTREPSAHGTGHRPAACLPPDVTLYEPREALFAGPSGMDVLFPLYEECRSHPHCIGCILECRQEQGTTLALRPVRDTQGRPENLEGRQAQGRPSAVPSQKLKTIL